MLNLKHLALGLFLLVSTLPVTAKAAAPFRAGAAVTDITGWLGLSINGNMTDHVGTNVHDPLHARAIAFDDGQTRLAIVLADNCLIAREIFDAAKKRVHERTGLAPENILMAATHTHSAPAALALYQSEPDKNYQLFLAARIADAVELAIANLEPAELGWGSRDEPRHVSNRRWKMKPGIINRDPFGGTNDLVKMNPKPGSPDLLEPAGPTDPEVSILAVRSPKGKPIALLANYSMHYCGGVPGRTYSADYFGAFCDRVQQLLNADRQDPPFVAIMSNGTSGDCNSMNFREPAKPEQSYERIHRVANDIAELARDVYSKLRWRSSIELKSAHTELTLAVRKPDETRVQWARDVLAKAKKQNDQYPGWGSEVYALETLAINDFPDQVPVFLQAFRIGGLGIAATPCETFAELGLAIKKESAVKPCFTIELANGHSGYLPTPAQHKLGGYETWCARSSYLETDAAPKIQAALLNLFQQVK